MLSPLHPLSSSRPLREGRRVPNSDFVSASVRLLLVGARLTPAADLYSTARHEAGHAIAAHAVGRRVVALRCTRKELAADDPINPYEVPFMTYGFHQSEPLRGAEVQECLREGARLPAELQHWCLQDAVICLAGPIAEGILGEEGSGHDIAEWAKSAIALGQPGRSGTRFYDATAAVARTIIEDLDADLRVLIVRLIREGEMETPSIADALQDLPSGSHTDLLEALL